MNVSEIIEALRATSETGADPDVIFAAADALEQAQAQHDAPTCEWRLDDSDSGTWASGCGELWQFNDGGPKENSVRFCHGCGKPVVVKEQIA